MSKTDTIGWHEWPVSQRKATQKPRTDLPPIHEPEPGLLDEEILPLRDDWMKGPKKGCTAVSCTDIKGVLTEKSTLYLGMDSGPLSLFSRMSQRKAALGCSNTLRRLFFWPLFSLYFLGSL